MKHDPHTLRTVRTGFCLLAISLPLGLTLEALHAWKVEVYLGSALRRELWTLAHAHANLLALLLLVFGTLGERWLPAERARARAARALCAGALLMPLGFFLGGVMNREGDPSLGILLVPLGGLVLLYGLVEAARAARGPHDQI
jgi:hypothetical protein